MYCGSFYIKEGTSMFIIDNMRKREESEKQRYKEYYDLDPNDEKAFDLIVDTADIKAEQVADKIVDFLKEKNKI